MACCTGGIGYRLRDVFDGVVHTTRGRTHTWEVSPWWFTGDVVFLVVLTGLLAFLSYLTLRAAISLFGISRSFADAERAQIEADQAVANAEQGSAPIESRDTDQVIAEADRAIAEADRVIAETDEELRSLKRRDSDR